MTSVFADLVVALLVGAAVPGRLHFNPLKGSARQETPTEVAVLISLFAAAVQPLMNRFWRRGNSATAPP